MIVFSFVFSFYIYFTPHPNLFAMRVVEIVLMYINAYFLVLIMHNNAIMQPSENMDLKVV